MASGVAGGGWTVAARVIAQRVILGGVYGSLGGFDALRREEVRRCGGEAVGEEVDMRM